MKKNKRQSADQRRQEQKAKRMQQLQEKGCKENVVEKQKEGFTDMAQEARKQTQTEKEKIHVKALGLKSILVMDDRIAVTSFADTKLPDRKGAAGEPRQIKTSNLEKVTSLEGDPIESVKTHERMFHVDIDREIIDLRAKGNEDRRVSLENPAKGNVGEDYIGVKAQLEESVFGRSFPMDNLHVQIAYNIFDIKKILGTYVNNIIYIFYNLNRTGEKKEEEEKEKAGAEGKQSEDLIGTLYTDKSLSEQEEWAREDPEKQETRQKALNKVKRLLKDTSPYQVYFGSLFKQVKSYQGEKSDRFLTKEELSEKKEKYRKEQEEEALSYNYNILRLLSLARQLCMHAQTGSAGIASLYNLDKELKEKNPELLALLDEKYKAGVEKLNRGFTKNAENNLYMLQKVYPDTPLDKLAEDYYYLTIRKEALNIGIDLRRLRSYMIEKYFPEAEDQRHDTYRSKIHTIFDFILIDYIRGNDGAEISVRQRMIGELRLAQKDDESKERIYRKYAGIYWEKVQNRWRVGFGAVIRQADSKFSGKAQVGKEFYEKSCVISEKNTDAFVKFLYFICKFLDGKEINELLCAMINKFDNIADLTDAGAACGKPIVFGENYMIFSRSRDIGEQLRIAKNLAAIEFTGVKKQKKKADKNELVYPEILYRDALTLLGYSFQTYKDGSSPEKLSSLSVEERKKWYTPEYMEFRRVFYETNKTDEYGNVKHKNGKPEINHQTRNFICNNVLMSKWFFYVVKYNRPWKCRTMMKNESLLRFVLRDIPDTQIDRYYETVMGRRGGVSQEDKRAELVNMLTKFSGKSILKTVPEISEREYKRQDPTGRKEKLKGIVRLYLTVAYLITKSMVKVNTRFSIAFATLERDYFMKIAAKDTSQLNGTEYLEMTKMAFEEDRAVFDKNTARWKELNGKIKAEAPQSEARKQLRKEMDKLRKEKTHYSFHWWSCLKTNMEEAEDLKFISKESNTYRKYRNAVAHLNVIDKMNIYTEGARVESYYGFYCYCMQMILLGERTEKGVAEKMAPVRQTGNYSRNLMWILNLPFAYNLARYKNLSNEALFYDQPDENEPGKKEALSSSPKSEKAEN